MNEPSTMAGVVGAVQPVGVRAAHRLDHRRVPGQEFVLPRIRRVPQFIVEDA